MAQEEAEADAEGEGAPPALYANRAACLLRLGRLGPCVADCDAALAPRPAAAKARSREGKRGRKPAVSAEHGVPERLRWKLLIRRAEAHRGLGQPEVPTRTRTLTPTLTLTMTLTLTPSLTPTLTLTLTLTRPPRATSTRRRCCCATTRRRRRCSSSCAPACTTPRSSLALLHLTLPLPRPPRALAPRLAPRALATSIRL